MSQSESKQIRRISFAPFLAVVVCLFVAGPALAQPAPQIPAVIKYDVNARRGNVTFKKALEDSALLSDQATLQAFDAYVHSYLLARLIMEENVTQLPELRDSIKRRLKPGPKGAGHDRYNTIALDVLKKILAGRYAPVVSKHASIVRYNAVLMIGNLNQEEEVKRGPIVVSPARPYAPALDEMLRWVGNARVPDYMKAAVLRGLLRHAKANIVGTRAASTQTAMIALLGAKTPPAGRSAKVHAWMRRRAADVLGAMKSNGQNDAVFDALEAVLKGAGEPLLVRGTAAAALSQLPLSSVSGMTAPKVQELQALIQKTRDEANQAGAVAPVPKAPETSKTPVAFPAP